MIYDLNEARDLVELDADVGIVGGGIAGLLLADKLRRAGKRVIVLESGARALEPQTQRLNELDNSSSAYRGATDGRARCLGGTSILWGGALLPFLPEDFEARPHLDLPSWPISYSDIAAYLPEIEALFHVSAQSYDSLASNPRQNTAERQSSDFATRFAKWPHFSRRNIATILGPSLQDAPRCQIWLNATARDFDLDCESGRLRAVGAVSLGGRRLQLRAPHFVICAGAIETTRLMLWLDAQQERRPLANCDALGRYFHDHVTAVLADIKTDAPLALNRLAGVRFEPDTLRSLRYEITPGAQRKDLIGSGFAHISYSAAGPSGFDALREYMRANQRKDAGWEHILRAASDLPYLAVAAYWRLAYKQLYWPRPGKYELHVVVEQTPAYGNRVSLSSCRDATSVPIAKLDWTIGEREIATFRGIANRFDCFWRQSDLNSVGRLEWRFAAGELQMDNLVDASDIFHPGGSTRMGIDPTQSVVDRDLSVHAIPNLSVASTSVFPSGASANPTLTLMMLTARLADRLAQLP